MRRPPRTTNNKASSVIAIVTVCAGIQTWCGLSAQIASSGFPAGYSSNFASRLSDSIPVGGFNGLLPTDDTLDLGANQELGEGLKGAFLYGVGVSSTYDSNFFLSENNPESELMTSFTGKVSYWTDPEGGAPVSIIASYSPSIQTYLEHSENNGIDQSANVKLNINGTKTVISAYVDLTETSGTDPLIGEFVTESLFSTGIEGNYQIAPRTSISASFAAATSDFGSGSVVGSNVYTTFVSGSWAATEYFSFGPEIQYIKAVSDNSGTRDAWQLLMQAQYRVGQRIQVSGSLGLDYAKNSRDDGSATVGLTGSFNANYTFSERLSWSSSIIYVTVPSPNDVDYVVNNLTISTALSRKLLRAIVNTGLALNVASYEEVGPTAIPLDNENNLTAFVSYTRSLFLERVSLVSTLFYSINDGQSEWSQLQLSLGLSAQF